MEESLRKFMTGLMLCGLLLGSLVFLGSVQAASLILSENFEDGILDSRISIETVGTFNANPGIKDITNFGSMKAFGFGVSTCGASCFDNYVTNFKITLPEPTYITTISFKEMELYGNWGSRGTLYIDGVPNYLYNDFGRLPHNDLQPDTIYREKTFSVNHYVTTIELEVDDITVESEIFIDDLEIFGDEIPITDGLTQARSVGIAEWNMRMSGIHWNGKSLVGDFVRNGSSFSLVPNSTTISSPPQIGNLTLEAFPNDIDACGTDYPDRVRFTFDCFDKNADILAGRVGITYSVMTRDGFGPITGTFVFTFFPQPKPGLILDPPISKRGVVTIDTCWGNVAHIDCSVMLKDGDENLSVETLSGSIDIPLSALTETDMESSKTGGVIKGW